MAVSAAKCLSDYCQIQVASVESRRSTTAVIFLMWWINSSRCVSRAPLVARALSAPLANVRATPAFAAVSP